MKVKILYIIFSWERTECCNQGSERSYEFVTDNKDYAIEYCKDKYTYAYEEIEFFKKGSIL